MKFKSILVVALAAAVPALACAKKPKKVVEEPVEEEVALSAEECQERLSIFNESVKNKMYADAYEPWKELYSGCPGINKAIYSQGAKMIKALYQTATDPAEKERLAKLGVEMNDKRIKYFGNDPKYPTNYILGEKGLAYVEFYGDTKLSEARECLRQSVDAMGAKSKMEVLETLAEVSRKLYKQNPETMAEQFIGDYELVSTLLGAQAADENNKNAEYAAQKRDYVDELFATSGAADCAKLDEIYASAVQQNLSNLEMLQGIAKLYKRVRCTESEVYFAACEAAHKLQPTQETAAGCASMAAKKGDYEAAINYYDQAITMATVDDAMEDVADYQYNAAYYYYNNLKKYPEARKYAQASIATLNGLGLNKGQGRCYIIIGMCYAATQLYGNDAKGRILNKTVYWVAVDKFVRAKQIDPSVEAQATEFINSYSKYYPTKEERFDLPNEFTGSTYHVGGWINENTVIR